MFPFLKKSKAEQIRDNRIQGKAAEEEAKQEYRMNGYEVEDRWKGSDFKATRKDWFTGKKETKEVEVKSGNAKLSRLQKITQRRKGRNYVVDRRNPNPLFYGIGSFNVNILNPQKSKSKKQENGNSIFGFGSNSSKKSKRKQTDSFSALFGGSSSSSRKSKKRQRDSFSALFGGSSSSSRKSKKRQTDSFSALFGGSSSSSRKSKRRKRAKSASDSFESLSGSTRKRSSSKAHSIRF